MKKRGLVLAILLFFIMPLAVHAFSFSDFLESFFSGLSGKATITGNAIMVSGYPLDWCSHLGCGQATANLYCQKAGLGGKATTFQTGSGADMRFGGTGTYKYSASGGAHCQTCDAYFTSVSCGSVCSSNTECGTDGWVGGTSCSGNDVYQGYRAYICNSPGSSSASCSYQDTSKLKQQCQNGCSNGACKPYKCYSNADCGSDAWEGTPACSYSPGGYSQVKQDRRIYSCINPGTPFATCTSNVYFGQIKQDCAKSSCDNWVNYCEGGNVYKKRTCNDRGCENAACYNRAREEKEKVADCPAGCSNGNCLVPISAVKVNGYPLDWCHSNAGCGEVVARAYCSRNNQGIALSYTKGTGAKIQGGTYQYTSTGGRLFTSGDEYFATLQCSGQLACEKDSDCGTNGWIGNVTCYSNRLWQNYRAFRCENVGTAQAKCSAIEDRRVKQDCPGGCEGDACKATCSSNADCGEEGWIGDIICFDGNVQQNYRTYACNNPGTSSASCMPNEGLRLKESCAYGCSNGNCKTPVSADAPKVEGYLLDWCDNSGFCGESVARTYCSRIGQGNWKSFSKGIGALDAGGTYRYSASGGQHNTVGDVYFASLICSGDIECSKDSDCGTDGWIGDVSCFKKTSTTPARIVQGYREYACSNPGTSQAACSVKEDLIKTKLECPNDCEGTSCKAACSSNSDCGADGWIDAASCFDNNVYQKYRAYACNNPGTDSASCSPQDEFKLKESCSADCYNGKCIVPIPSTAPRENGYPIDYCSSAGCGTVAANTYCGRAGQGIASTYTTGTGASTQGGTWRYSSTGGSLNTRGDDYFTSITCTGPPKQITQGALQTLGTNQKATFIVSGQSHTLTVTSVAEDSVEMLIESEPIRLTLKIGDTKEVDVNGDGRNDIVSSIKYITNGKAVLYLKEIVEEVQPLPPQFVPPDAIKVNSYLLDSCSHAGCGLATANIYCGRTEQGIATTFTTGTGAKNAGGTWQYAASGGYHRADGDAYFITITCEKEPEKIQIEAAMVNGHPLDHCSDHLKCDQETADLYCRRKGMLRASDFNTSEGADVLTGGTGTYKYNAAGGYYCPRCNVYFTRITCTDEEIVTARAPANDTEPIASQAPINFTEPGLPLPQKTINVSKEISKEVNVSTLIRLSNGSYLPLSYCSYLGCGQPTGNLHCKRLGYEKLDHHTWASDAYKYGGAYRYTATGGQICKTCDKYFSSISCIKSETGATPLAAQQLETLPAETVAEAVKAVMVNGLPLSWCSSNDKNRSLNYWCGKETADLHCNRTGQGKALIFKRGAGIGSEATKNGVFRYWINKDGGWHCDKIPDCTQSYYFEEIVCSAPKPENVTEAKTVQSCSADSVCGTSYCEAWRENYCGSEGPNAPTAQEAQSGGITGNAVNEPFSEEKVSTVIWNNGVGRPLDYCSYLGCGQPTGNLHCKRLGYEKLDHHTWAAGAKKYGGTYRYTPSGGEACETCDKYFSSISCLKSKAAVTPEPVRVTEPEAQPPQAPYMPGSVYRSRICHDVGCSDGTCYENIREEKEKVIDCPSGCVNGACIEKQQAEVQAETKCADGSLFNSCSSSKPKYCDSGTLANNCQTCGCPAGEECKADGSCTENLCVTMQDSGDPSTKLDILFIGDDYTESSLGVFRSDATNFMNGLLSYEPFRSQRNKINVHRVDSTQDLGCEYNCHGIDRAICCDNLKVAQAATQCPHDYTLVIVNNNNYGGGAGLYAVSYRGDYRVIVHEFGHIIGELMDEYSYGTTLSGTPWGGNCAADSTCSVWSNLIGVEGVGCFKGCTSDTWYRPLQSGSIMTDLNGDFNPVGERMLAQQLKKYK